MCTLLTFNVLLFLRLTTIIIVVVKTEICSIILNWRPKQKKMFNNKKTFSSQAQQNKTVTKGVANIRIRNKNKKKKKRH